jgi:hypothetical protein
VDRRRHLENNAWRCEKNLLAVMSSHPMNRPAPTFSQAPGAFTDAISQPNGKAIYNKPDAERAWGKLVVLYKSALA